MKLVQAYRNQSQSAQSDAAMSGKCMDQRVKRSLTQGSGQRRSRGSPGERNSSAL